MPWQHDLNTQLRLYMYGDVAKRRATVHPNPEHRGTQDFSRLPTALLTRHSRDDQQAQGQPDTCPAG